MSFLSVERSVWVLLSCRESLCCPLPPEVLQPCALWAPSSGPDTVPFQLQCSRMMNSQSSLCFVFKIQAFVAVLLREQTWSASSWAWEPGAGMSRPH